MSKWDLKIWTMFVWSLLIWAIAFWLGGWKIFIVILLMHWANNIGMFIKKENSEVRLFNWIENK